MLNQNQAPDAIQSDQAPQQRRDAIAKALHCRAHVAPVEPAPRSERVLVLGEGSDIMRTVLELLTENDVTLLYTRSELQQLDIADRLLLLELVAEDELVLVDGDAIGKLAATSDGRCEVCLDGPDEGCSIYDQLVLCGDEVLSCKVTKANG